MSKRAGPSLRDIRARGRKNKAMHGVTADIIDLQLEDIYEKASSCRNFVKLCTGLVYDDRFQLHRCLWDKNYPEKPQRYNCIIQRMNEVDLIERCKKIDSRDVNLEELCTLHSAELIDLLNKTRDYPSVESLETLASQYDAIYFNEHTASAASLAAGSVINLVEAVVKNEVQNGMAMVRPPGHHAMQNKFCGYCFYNNVALAARYALDKLSVKRILIVDWDVHHGQGTQQMFYDDDRVLYFSIHRYEHGTFWPNLRESEFDYIGTGKGEGYNINVPLNETGCSNMDYMSIITNILLPVATEFEPEVVLISAGYDSALGDDKGKMEVTPGFYHQMTTWLMGLAKGKVVAVLEGGYFLPSLAEAATQTLRALLGDPCPIVELHEKPKYSTVLTIYNVMFSLKSKWHCFDYLSQPWENDEGEDDRPVHTVSIKYLGEEGKPPFETRNCYPKNSASQIKDYTQEVERLRHSYYTIDPCKVGIFYHEDMLKHLSKLNNYEKPDRLTDTMTMLKELSILDRLEETLGYEAQHEDLAYIHKEDYINTIQNIGHLTEVQANKKFKWSTVFTNQFTNTSARMGVGGLIAVVRSVLGEKISSGLALIRPPGHHAEADKAMGFCIFNNVAIAAKYALSRGLTRVLIVDWDVHHGNGIQNSFYNDNKVLYISLHRYDHGKFFPNTFEGDYRMTGWGSGFGYNVNISWNTPKMGDVEYITAFHRVILPIAYEFNPELVLIAAGFDACKGDPLGGYKVSPEAFGHFVQLLKPLAGGKIILVLEGGYNTNSVAYSFAMCAKALLNDPIPPLDIKDKEIDKGANEIINKVIELHCLNWSLLVEQAKFQLENETESG